MYGKPLLFENFKFSSSVKKQSPGPILAERYCEIDSVYGAESPETLLRAKTHWAKMTIFWLGYISVKTDTQLKVEKLDPISEVVVQESFDRSICKFLGMNKHLLILPYLVGKIKQLKHLFPPEDLIHFLLWLQRKFANCDQIHK